MQDTYSRPTEEKYGIKTILSSACSEFTPRFEGDQRGSEGRDMNSGAVYFQKERLCISGEAY